jgi:hypothetical protein
MMSGCSSAQYSDTGLPNEHPISVAGASETLLTTRARSSTLEYGALGWTRPPIAATIPTCNSIASGKRLELRVPRLAVEQRIV